MATIYPPSSTAASTAIGYVLLQLDAGGTYDQMPMPGLPDGVHVPERDVLLINTPAPAPLFRAAAERLAAERRLDVALLRVGDLVDDAVVVIVDLTLAALPHNPWPLRNLSLWAGPAGQLALVPEGFGPAVAVTPEGLLLDLLPPFASMAERKIGVARAARDIARIFSPKEAR